MPRVKILSVFGLGKLGLCLAAVFASRGFRVIGVDVDEAKVSSLNQGVSPIYEPGLDMLIKSNKSRLSGTTDHAHAVSESGATFVVVPTPSEDSGEFSLKYVIPAMRSIASSLSNKEDYHLVVLTSTVTPGSMEAVVRPALEKHSQKKCSQDFGLCYNPEFIALGDVVRGLMEPDFVLIGESDRKAGDELASIQSKVCEKGPPIERMNLVNAELAKIAVNSYVTMKVSFANTLAEICENLRGADVDIITEAIGKDKRIGSAYLKGALGYGGPCFPRDNAAFSKFAERLGVKAELAIKTHEINERQVERVIRLIQAKGLQPPMRVAVLGLTYKPNTNITEASQSLMLAKALRQKGYEVRAYDPSLTTDRHVEGLEGVVAEKSVEDCIMKSNLCIIATPWDAFSKIDKSLFADKIVLDCWRIYGPDGVQRAARYFALGRDLLGVGKATA